MNIEEKGERGKNYAKASSSDRRECLWIGAVAGNCGNGSYFCACTGTSRRVETTPDRLVWKAIGICSLRGGWGAYPTRAQYATGSRCKARYTTCAGLVCD